MEDFLVHGLSVCVKKHADDLYTEGKISAECLSSFKDVSHIIETPLVYHQTEHKRFNYFTKQGTYTEQQTYTEPKEVVIGQRMTDIRKDGITLLEPCPCTEQLIPLSDVLGKFLSLENVLDEILQFIQRSCNRTGLLTNFVQGTYWQDCLKK